MLFSTEALVLRCMDTSDYDRILTLLTPDQGRISVIAKGVRARRADSASACQPMFTGATKYTARATQTGCGAARLSSFSAIYAPTSKSSHFRPISAMSLPR